VLRLRAGIAANDDRPNHAAEEVTRRIDLASAGQRLPRRIAHLPARSD
jgi:hypothetical protein